jgi:hypothetical protein
MENGGEFLREKSHNAVPHEQDQEDNDDPQEKHPEHRLFGNYFAEQNINDGADDRAPKIIKPS